MKNEDIVKIHLPNGKVYEVILKETDSKLTDEEINRVRQLFGGASTSNIQITVKPDKTNGMLKETVLVLWGDTLKNSYITVDRYPGT